MGKQRIEFNKLIENEREQRLLIILLFIKVCGKSVRKVYPVRN